MPFYLKKIQPRKYQVSQSIVHEIKGVRALRGFFGPLWGQKIKVALHNFLFISLLEQ